MTVRLSLPVKQRPAEGCDTLTTTSCRSEAAAEPIAPIPLSAEESAESEPTPALFGTGTAGTAESCAQKELLEFSGTGDRRARMVFLTSRSGECRRTLLVNGLLIKGLLIKGMGLGAGRGRYAEIVHRTCGSRASCE
jgi:hypothetical protein